ncbi:MAG: hypothetical protein LBB88_02390 [Planctomycetaceae bacterium]|jgi:hypothetical protein|nr:hypothetical protein [Planctomycetaceae bacterium]
MTYNNNDDLELEPINDDDLELEPIEDDEAKKQIAPDIPFNAGVRLIPVICSACKTRLYAGEDQVGLWKRCPDCYRLTEIRAVLPKFILTADDPEAAGGYNLRDAEVSKNDIIKLKNENLNNFEIDQKKREINRQKDKLPPPVLYDEPQVMEGILNNLLKSNQEKDEENKIREREKQIENKVDAVKKAAQAGNLDGYLASQSNEQQKIIDPAERKRIEKQRQFDSARTSTLTRTSSASSTMSSSSSSPPPPIPLRVGDQLRSQSTLSSSSERLEARSFGFISMLLPLFDQRCRWRMIFLTIFGLIGNLTGEKARSMIWQASIDKVYDKSPGYAYNLAESSFLFVNFWVGAVLSLVWLSMLFLFGISLFESAASGRDRVERWIPFNLDFGFSYIGWLFFILFISGFPGFIVWHTVGFFLPDYDSSLIILHYAGQFFCFPILFLCVIESDTFYGKFPFKTLTSFYKCPELWFWMYSWAVVFAGIPIFIIVGLMFMGTVFFENWFMQSVFYYIIASFLLTFCGYFILLYFRLLGKMAWELKLEE